MNNLDEMDIAELSEKELESLMNSEKEINKMHNGDEIYLLALKR